MIASRPNEFIHVVVVSMQSIARFKMQQCGYADNDVQHVR